MLLDTNIVSTFLKRGVEERAPKLFAFVNGILASGTLTISTFTEFELRRGVEHLVLKGQGTRRLVTLVKLFALVEHRVAP